MEVADASEKLGTLYKITRLHVPEDRSLDPHFKVHNLVYVSVLQLGLG
jgi:hypothetical protein